MMYCPIRGDSLALLTANRALALSQLGRLGEALADIQLARDRGYPPTLVDKLNKREATCRQALLATDTDCRKNIDNGNSCCKLSDNNDKPTCDINNSTSMNDFTTTFFTPSTWHQCLKTNKTRHHKIVINKIEVYRDEAKGGGRAVRARSAIKTGDLLLAERAFSTTILAHHLDRLCENCLRVTDHRQFHCRQCTQVVYCDADCEQQAWTQFHSAQCGYIDFLDDMDSGMFSPRLVLKIILRLGGLKNLLNTTNGANKRVGDTLNGNDSRHDKLHFGQGYEGFCDLAQFDSDTNDYRSIATFLVAFCMKAAESNSDNSNPTVADLMPVRDLVIRHIRRCQVNSMHLHERFLTKGETDADKASGLTLLEERKTGCGLFVALAMTNHSCSPNAKAAFFDGDVLHLLAIKG